MKQFWYSPIQYKFSLPLFFVMMGLLLLLGVIICHRWINGEIDIASGRSRSSVTTVAASGQESVATMAINEIINDDRNLSNFPRLNDDMTYSERLFYLDRFYRSSQGFIMQE